MKVNELELCFIDTPFGQLSLVPVTDYHQCNTYKSIDDVFALPAFLFPNDGKNRGIQRCNIKSWCDDNGFNLIGFEHKLFQVDEQKYGGRHV